LSHAASWKTRKIRRGCAGKLHCRPAAPLCFCAASLAALREEIDQQTRHFDPRHAPGRPNAFSNQIILEIK
jgi:hypothetical protein